MKALFVVSMMIFTLYVFAENAEPQGQSLKDQCKVNDDETEVSCANGKVYKLHHGPTDLTLRINPKFDLEDLPARRPAGGL